MTRLSTRSRVALLVFGFLWFGFWAVVLQVLYVVVLSDPHP